MIPFVPFPKIARLNREIVITEKIDGTNALVHIADDGVTVTAGSRTRWITPDDDNFGFAAWVEEHSDELRRLGPGSHFGEWWGRGIQRGYGLDHRRFSLFNTHRWADGAVRPTCCYVVPVMYRGPMSLEVVRVTLAMMCTLGSTAAPWFPKPEGVVVFHTASSTLYKVTCEKDESPKGIVAT